MPLGKTGKKVKAKMKKKYGSDRVFYATMNKNKNLKAKWHAA